MEEKTILYVEDNYHNRRIVRKILGTRGFTVIEAEDGLVGYEMICEIKPPLVLLDIALPHLDGIQIVQRIKADSELRHIPVIALTASAMRGDRERFLEAGCNDYLSKPVRAQELIEMVEKYFESENGSSSIPATTKEYKNVVKAASKVMEEKPLKEKSTKPIQAGVTEEETGETELAAAVQAEATEEKLSEVEMAGTVPAKEIKEKTVKKKRKTTTAKKKTAITKIPKPKKSVKTANAKDSEDKYEKLISNNVAELLSDVSMQLPSPDVSPELQEEAAVAGNGSNGTGSPAIWVMDENPSDSRLLRRVLGSKLKVEALEISPSNDLFTTMEQAPQLILYGVRKPDDKMYHVLNTIRTQENIAEVPIFLLATEGFNDSEKEIVAEYVELAWSKEYMMHADLLSNISKTLANWIGSKKKASNAVDAQPGSGPQKNSASQTSVLVIEDIADSAALATKILKSHHYKALVADSGETGLNLALEHRPDLILLDLGLPDVDGQTLLGFLKAEDKLKDTPVIVCTAWPKEALKEIVESYGFDGFISKPYKVAEFMKVVKDFTP